MSERRRPVRRIASDAPHAVPGYGPPDEGDDLEIDRVVEAILEKDPSGETFAHVLRETYDQLYDGQRTGRWKPEQLRKTEKTHMGTLVEINVHRAFDFEDGAEMDYRIDGIDVDCKFAAKLGGWMFPREAYERGHLCLVIWANEDLNRWEAGVVRAQPRSAGLRGADDDLLGSENQDRKRSLTPAGESTIRWLYDRPALPENLLLHIDDETRERIFDPNPGSRRKPSGQAKINMLFRLVQRRIVNRASVVTVAQQKDSPKRARDARLTKHLGKEGILVFGHQESDPIVAAALGLPVPAKGDFVSARVVRAGRSWDGAAAQIGGGRWRVADEADAVVTAPLMPRAGKAAADDE